MAGVTGIEPITPGFGERWLPKINAFAKPAPYEENPRISWRKTADWPPIILANVY
jgi:hypothetical protein